MTRLMHYSRERIRFDRSRVFEPRPAGPYTKPPGFWVSVEGPDDWPTWCQSEQFRLGTFEHAFEVTVDAGANVLTLASPEELHAFTARYGSVADGFGSDLAIAWGRVMLEYDGILIPTYQWSCRYDLSWYYGWDCASGCIWNLDVLTIAEVAAPVMDRAAA